MNEPAVTDLAVTEAPAPAPAPAPALLTRICITGSPLAGKADLSHALAAGLGVAARHTDETMSLGWSEASAAVAEWFGAPGPWVIEGVAVPRALRKWLAANPEGKPCDVVVVIDAPKVALNPGQERMRKGVATVWAEVRPQLEARGVEIR